MFREVTRKKQALSTEQVVNLLAGEKRGVLSVIGDDGYPYGMPMNFWYNEDNGHIYFHSGKSGHKIEALEKDNRVSFCIYDQGFRREGEWALNICSVIIFGRVRFLDNNEEAMEICRRLSLKYTDDNEYIEHEIQNSGRAALCFELIPEHITGKIVNES